MGWHMEESSEVCVVPCSSTAPHPCPLPPSSALWNHLSTFCLNGSACLVHINLFHINKFIHYVVFCNWFFPLSGLQGSLKLQPRIITSFFFTAKYMAFGDVPHLSCLLISQQILGLFLFCAYYNKASKNLHVQVLHECFHFSWVDI